MLKPMLTDNQVDLLEQLDDYIEWIELSGSASSADIEYLQELINKLGESISKSEKERNELDKTSTWPEAD